MLASTMLTMGCEKPDEPNEPVTCFAIPKAAPDSNYFYNHLNEKVFLTLNTGYAFLSAREPQLPDDIAQRGITATGFQSCGAENKQGWKGKTHTPRYGATLSINNELTEEQYLELLADIKLKNPTIIIAPFFKMPFEDKVRLSPAFYVKLKDENDVELLEQTAEETCCIIMWKMFDSIPLWYTLSVTETSEANALEYAIFLYESGLFESVSADLAGENILH